MKARDILLVEDNEGDIFLITEALKQTPTASKLNVVKDGKQALDLLHKKPPFSNAATPDLILLDINLPKKNGHEILDDIKEDQNLKFIPVIMLTTSSSPKDVMEAYKRHANCFITKPVDADNFYKVVNTIESFWTTVVTLPNN